MAQDKLDEILNLHFFPHWEEPEDMDDEDFMRGLEHIKQAKSSIIEYFKSLVPEEVDSLDVVGRVLRLPKRGMDRTEVAILFYNLCRTELLERL